MAQLDPIHRLSVHTSRTPKQQSSLTPKQQSSLTPKQQISPTFEQLLQQGDSSNWQWNNNTTPPSSAKNQDREDYFTPQSKKSVLSKVKEKAKKLKHTLSGRKKNDFTQPTWGVKNDDEEQGEDDEDPEYLGAPMYESAKAPETYKENARQNPRAYPVVSEKNSAPSNFIKEEEHIPPPVNKTITETVQERLAPAYAAMSETVQERLVPAYAAMSGTVQERLAPAYAAMSVATNTIASKVASLTISGNSEDHQHNNNHATDSSAQSPSPAESYADLYSAAGDIEYLDRYSEFEEKYPNDQIEKSSSSPQKWDKGVSVKEFLMNKLEPGEDEKALSKVISEAISPKKRATDKGVAEKVREAVTSFLRNDVPPSSTNSTFNQTNEKSVVNNPSQTISQLETRKSGDNSSLNSPKLLRQKSVHSTSLGLSSSSSTNPVRNRVTYSPPIPVSTNPQEVEEENYGRILQTN